jgi:hypothetical protein
MSDEKDGERDEAVDETGADGAEREAKAELFEAIDHFKNAASILFERATNDPAVRSATKEAGRLAKKIGDAAEPLAKQLTGELSRLTRDVMEVVEGKPKKTAPQTTAPQTPAPQKTARERPAEADDEEE